MPLSPFERPFFYPKIILFGDSLTQLSFAPHGVGSLLSEAYARKADVLNRGISGYNSRWLLPLFKHTLRQLSTDDQALLLLFVIWVGTNDACLPGSAHHVPLIEFKKNLYIMIDELRSCSKTKNTRILVITPPPIYTPLLREKGPRNGEDRHYDITSSYALGVLDVMRELTMETEHIQSLDFHATIEAATDDYCAIFYEEDVPGHAIERIQTAMDDIFTDGLHLGKRGYRLLFEAMLNKIRDKWPEIAPENVPLVAPWWGELAAQPDTECSG